MSKSLRTLLALAAFAAPLSFVGCEEPKKETAAVKKSPFPDKNEKDEKHASRGAPPRKAKRPAVAQAKQARRERIVLNWERTAIVKWERKPDDRPVRVDWQAAQR